MARSVARMGLRHAVITSVDRDDLPDYGAARLRRRDPPDPPAGAGLQGRGADARLPRRGDAAGEGDRRAPRRVQPQRRGRAAAVPGRPPRLALRALAAACCATPRRWAATRSSTKSGPDGRPRRDARGDGRGLRRRCASTASRSSPSASTCARPSATCRSCATGTPTSSPRSSAAAYALGFEHVAAGPLVRSSYHADEHVPQERPGAGPLAASGSPGRLAGRRPCSRSRTTSRPSASRSSRSR